MQISISDLVRSADFGNNAAKYGKAVAMYFFDFRDPATLLSYSVGGLFYLDSLLSESKSFLPGFLKGWGIFAGVKTLSWLIPPVKKAWDKEKHRLFEYLEKRGLKPYHDELSMIVSNMAIEAYGIMPR